MRRSLSTLAAVLSLTSCGDDGGAGDAGANDGAIAFDATSGVTPPAPPAMTPCPTGWVERTSASGVVTCDPWPDGTRVTCTGATAQFPGQAGCETVGSACPADGIPTGLPAGATVIHVRAGASGGDGSVGSPYGTITQAMSRATSGAIVAVGPGSYDEAPPLRPGVTVWGACVAEVTWTSSSAVTNMGVVTPTGAGTVVKNLRIAGAARPAAFIGAGDLHLEDVVVDDVAFAGIVVVAPGHLDADRLVVRGTRSNASRVGGASIVVLDGTAAVRVAALERNRDIGVVLEGPTASLVLEDAVVSDTEGRDGTGANGRGVESANGSLVELHRVAIEGNREYGILVWQSGRAILEDVIVRDGRVRASESNEGMGIVVAQGGSIEARRLLLERNISAEVFIFDGTATIEDAVFRETFADATDGYFGRALGVQTLGDVTLRRVVMEQNRDMGIFAGGPVTVHAEDLVVRDNQSTDMDGLFGRGIEATDRAEVTVERALFERTRELAAGAFLDGVLTLTDVVVRDVLPRACAPGCSPGGTGIGGYDRGIVQARRFLVTGATLCGAQVAEGGQVDLMSGEISGSPVGACIQVDGYDVTRLSNAVVYRDNGTNLDSTMLPVPGAATELGP